MVNNVPYWADTVNYATINEAAKITEYINLACQL